MNGENVLGSLEGGLLQSQILSMLVSISRLLVFLVTTSQGLAILLGAIGFSVLLYLLLALRRAHLLSLSAGRPLSFGDGFLTALGSLIQVGTAIVTALPTLLFLAMMGLTLVSLGTTIEKVDAVLQGQKKIRELQQVLKHLEQSSRVADVTIHSTRGGMIHFSVDFYNPAHPATAAEHREFEIRGKELFIDAIVCNFEYSEISAGRKVNLAIPYRVFSDEIPQAEGIPLGGYDAEGVPYMYYRAEGDIYGMSPALYRERLVELMGLLRTDSQSRAAGVVRSLYGSAIHRRVSPGDRYEIRVEGTGGLTLKEKVLF